MQTSFSHSLLLSLKKNAAGVQTFYNSWWGAVIFLLEDKMDKVDKVDRVYEYINDYKGRVSALGVISLLRLQKVRYEIEEDEQTLRIIVLKEG